MSRGARAALVAGCLVAGVALMIPFDAAITRALGVACLVGFIAGGLFLIADPALLSDDEGEER